MKVIFFLESLHRGGKERRALELIHFLKNEKNFEIVLVLTEDEIYYKSVYDLGIIIKIIKRRCIKYDIRLFYKFYKYCRRFKPDIIHTWGKMTTFYAVPAKLICNIPLVSNLISDADRSFKFFSFDAYFIASDIRFSDVVLANSKAGLLAYKVKTPKAMVITNGVRLERFQQQFNKQRVREEFKISTEYVVIMVASFTKYKDYDLFIDTAKEYGKLRHNVTFLAVGYGSEWNRINQRISNEKIYNVVLTGMQTEVEPIIAASDIGLLCTYSEGISNSIIEYMAMGKPVISTDIIGGSREIIVEGETGYCIERNKEKLINLIDKLLNDDKLRISMGEKGKKLVNSQFSVERMGEEFVTQYQKVLSNGSRKENSGH